MGAEFLTIKEFAAAAGITVQSIYKRLNNKEDELQAFYKEQGGKKYISAAALSVIYNKEEKQHEEAPTESKTTESQIIEILREQIEAQRKDIEEKNKLIDTLAAQLEREQQLLNQEQQLNLVNTQKILALEAAATEEANIEIPTEETKRKGIFSIFRRKETK